MMIKANASFSKIDSVTLEVESKHSTLALRWIHESGYEIRSTQPYISDKTKERMTRYIATKEVNSISSVAVELLSTAVEEEYEDITEDGSTVPGLSR